MTKVFQDTAYKLVISNTLLEDVTGKQKQKIEIYRMIETISRNEI